MQILFWLLLKMSKLPFSLTHTKRNPTMQEKQRAMRWMAKEKICPMVARTKRTDGRTRFFGSLTQLSLSSSSVGRISSYSPTEKVGSHNSCE
jgi:hypothetical protein